MNRAMFSGVAGMKAHQSKMDVIGNNIANVNTYGFKSQRAIFSDIFYQTIRNASGGTGNRGGTNPSTVGYGTSLSSVQTQMTQSSMQNTGFGLDVAITGEGFLQVMDPDGNIFYTKAGLLDYDSNGYLTDVNGNFVLGGTGSEGDLGSQKIRLDSVGSVDPKAASVTESINSIQYLMEAQNPVAAGNVSFNFASSSSITDGVPATAQITTSGIIVTFNASETFNDWADVNKAINDAITAANGGKPHAAGNFTMKAADPAKDPFDAANMPPQGYLTGAELTSGDFNVQYGKVSFNTNNNYFGGITPSGKVGATYSGDGALSNYKADYNAGPPEKWTVSVTVGGAEYKGEIDSTKTGAGKFNLYKVGSNDDNDYIEMNRPSFDAITTAWKKDSQIKGAKSVETITPPAAAIAAGTSITIGSKSIMLNSATVADQNTEIIDAINADSAFEYTAALVAGKIVLTAKESGAKTTPATGYGTIANTTAGTPDQALATGSSFANAYATGKYPQLTGTSKASGKSYALGLATTALLLKGGTEGGLVTLDELSSIAIGSDGTVSVSHAEKGTVIVGRITLASFANQGGLQQAGTNYYSATANSGEAQLSAPGTGGTGALKSSALEMSNVDLSSEFSDMITTQRGFQANSRVITVSDTMLEELINLKR